MQPAGVVLLVFGISQSVSAQLLHEIELQPHTAWGYLTVSFNPRWAPVSADQATELERQLRSDPDNLELRSTLLTYYYRQDLQAQRIDSICWLIEHHPESLPLSLDIAWVRSTGPGSDPAVTERVRELWDVALSRHSSEPEALHNAGRFFEEVDLARSVELVERLQMLDRVVHTRPVAYFEGRLVPASQLGAREPAVRHKLADDLLFSTDALMVGSVARELVGFAVLPVIETHRDDLGEICTIVFPLIARARALEPHNQQWTDLSEGAKRLRCAVNAQPVLAPTRALRVAVSASGQASRLLQLVAPLYPPAARQARIQGIVTAHVTVGTDGHVKEATLISGHPLLAPAALEALKQYVYSPMVLDGQLVEVSSEVDVPFRLD